MKDKILYIPRMSRGAAQLIVSVFQSFGIDARISPPSDEQTLEYAARFTTGEECLPQRVVLGNFLKVIYHESFVPSKTVFFMPTSSGPCRFGQYAPLLRKILNELGYHETLVLSPSSSNGYDDIDNNTSRVRRMGWRSLVASDLLRKMLLMFRPYESRAGEADDLYQWGLDRLSTVFRDSSITLKRQLKLLTGELEGIRDRFLNLILNEIPGTRPLIGVVGEIYLRLNPFSNQSFIRKLEGLGAEMWLADISEWIWYTGAEQKRKLREAGKGWSLEMGLVKVKEQIQRKDEEALTTPLHHIFRDRKESRIETILGHSLPYLPAQKALGEMTLNTGKAISFFNAGCDGVVDISPFTCMNGIVTEAIYPIISRDHNNFPIRIFYFDGVPFDLNRDLEIFLELVKSYREKRIKK